MLWEEPPASILRTSNSSKLHGRNRCAVQGQDDGHNELMEKCCCGIVQHCGHMMPNKRTLQIKKWETEDKQRT